ncbi:hypothetical protein EMEDMD4_620050 [Sinorhizobium medicae]|uniref:Uncharacterized protein n=1 Tax=Sinorhizobium medicae TaxID=110321 RepID=A0A508X412_9HYPH|nr:hypothetical protein EMEDMD4_620050 [Sinorhizobium medicae]
MYGQILFFEGGIMASLSVLARTGISACAIAKYCKELILASRKLALGYFPTASRAENIVMINHLE